MKRTVRTAILAVCGLAIAGSLAAFFATGARAYTRFRDPELEKANSQTELSDLFAESGTAQPPPKSVESVNAIGFLPSGPGFASISVVTIAGPAAGVMIVLWWMARRSRLKMASEKTLAPSAL